MDIFLFLGLLSPYYDFLRKKTTIYINMLETQGKTGGPKNAKGSELAQPTQYVPWKGHKKSRFANSRLQNVQNCGKVGPPESGVSTHETHTRLRRMQMR